MVDSKAEVDKLHEQLALCQRELAQVRRQQETEAQKTATNSKVAGQLRELTIKLDQRLARSESAPGARGWVKRRLLATMPTAQEQADLTILRSSKLMNGPWYLRRYPDVVSTGLSPALHYLRAGAAEDKDPGPAFKTRAYLAQHPDLPRGTNPLLHFLANQPGTTS